MAASMSLTCVVNGQYMSGELDRRTCTSDIITTFFLFTDGIPTFGITLLITNSNTRPRSMTVWVFLC